MPYARTSTGLTIALHNVRAGRFRSDEADDVRRVLADADGLAESWMKEVDGFRQLLDEARQTFLAPKAEPETMAAVRSETSCCSNSAGDGTRIRNEAEAAMLLSKGKLLDAQADELRARMNPQPLT